MTRVNLDFSAAQAVRVHAIWDEQDLVELHTLLNFFRNEIDLKNAESYELFEILKKKLDSVDWSKFFSIAHDMSKIYSCSRDLQPAKQAGVVALRPPLRVDAAASRPPVYME